MDRFITKKRIALDGKEWWCVWDCKTNGWSTYLFHGKHKTKREAQYAIDRSLRYIKR